MLSTLNNLALVTYRLGDGPLAALLLGAGTRWRTETGKAISPANRPDWEETVAQARTLLGEAAFEQAWAEGQAMPLNDVIVLVLGGEKEPLN